MISNRPAWTLRLNESQTRQRVSKTELLPLPRPIRDNLSMQHHMQLEILKCGAGTLMSLQLLMRAALASAILHELGYGRALPVPLETYENTAEQSLLAGTEGAFQFTERAYRLFAHMITAHDWQLEISPVKSIAQVAKQLAKYGIR